MRLSKLQRRLREKQQAWSIAQVVKETGRFDLAEARRRLHPNASWRTNKAHGYEMLKGQHTMDYLEKFLKIRDKDIIAKLKPEVIVQDIIEDLNTLNELVEANKLDYEAVVKMLNAKGIKQKLLGLAIGMWKAEQPEKREKTASELLRLIGTGTDTNDSINEILGD